MSDFIPLEIILQILHNLPIKSLVRCTCVCKSWNSLIKNPSFISTHLTLTISSNTHLLLFRLCLDESEHYSLHFDNNNNNNNQQLCPYMVLDFPFRCYKLYFHVVGSFNGIICIIHGSVNPSKTFILWNPLIKKSITLPKPSATFLNHVSYKDFIGFGFDSITNDYKVLRIVHNDEDSEVEQEPFMEVELYSLNTNSWKTMTCVAPKYDFNKDHSQAFVNGVVHWIGFQYVDGLEYRNVVLGFDMGDEVFCEIKLPESLANVIPPALYLYVKKYGDSSIAVIENVYSNPFQFHIWVMKEYGVVESWTKLLSITAPGGEMSSVLGFRKSGEVLVQNLDGEIISYDPQNEGGKDLGLRNEVWLAFADSYVESLVLLDNANAVSDGNAANAVNDANAANDVIEDESNESMGATDNSSDAINGTSDDGSDAASDAAITLMQMAFSE